MECRICYENVPSNNLEILECSHSLCKKCLGKLRCLLCPFCRNPIIRSVTKKVVITQEIDYDIYVSNRINSRARKRARRYKSRRLQQEILNKQPETKPDKIKQKKRNSRNRWKQNSYRVGKR